MPSAIRAMRAEAVLLLGVVQRYLGEHAAAIARYEDALHWVTDPRMLARLHLRLAWLTEWSMQKSLEHADGALALLDPDEAPLDYSFALLTGARVRLHLGIAADHDAIARGEALQASAAERDWNVSTTPIDWAIWMEDWNRGRALLDAGARAAEEAGDETLAGALLRRRVELETWSGNLALAAELVETAVEQAELTQQLPSIASAKARRALVMANQGDIESAERDAAEAFAMAEGFDIPIILGYAATALAAAAIQQGDLGASTRSSPGRRRPSTRPATSTRPHIGSTAITSRRSSGSASWIAHEPSPTACGDAASWGRGQRGPGSRRGARRESPSRRAGWRLPPNRWIAPWLSTPRAPFPGARSDAVGRGRAGAAAWPPKGGGGSARDRARDLRSDRRRGLGCPGKRRAVAPVRGQDGAECADAERGADRDARLRGAPQPGDRRAAPDQREDRRGGAEPRLREAPDPVPGADRDRPAATRFIGIPLLP